MKTWIPISMMLVVLGFARSFGQAAPTATEVVTPTPGVSGPKLSWVDGTVHYALSASEIVQYGFFGSGDLTSTTALSGNVGWASMSQSHPSTLLFAGGVLFGQGGQGVSTYQNIAVSQGLIKGRWIFNVSDSFSFLPQSPTTGLSGVPGVGDVGTVPIQGPSAGPAGGILTYSGNRIANVVSGDIERRITGRTSVSGGASWSLLHFMDKNSGLDTSAVTGEVALNRRINPLSSASVSAVYSTYDTSGIYATLPPGFPNNSVTYYTKGINLSYSRQWTRLLSTDVSAGPQWIQTSAAQLIPDRLNFYVNAGLGYSRKLINYSMRYTHGVNGGSGVQPGGIADNFSASAGRVFSRQWAGSATFSYSHTTGLLVLFPNAGSGINGATNTEYGTLQVTRGFTRTISGYASYTAQNQSVNQVLSTQNAFSGMSHTFGIGITWAPQSKRLGEF
ncbi:hypothetical protein [Edaphobacter aggregans]|uniref:hypothetical protein n=1 Tax=Edaphobacter aggregans TaxID=570835 RepID=UPI0005575461|nr:hypothetical protein [Edaphobacter aggregans]